MFKVKLNMKLTAAVIFIETIWLSLIITYQSIEGVNVAFTLHRLHDMTISNGRKISRHFQSKACLSE